MPSRLLRHEELAALDAFASDLRDDEVGGLLHAEPQTSTSCGPGDRRGRDLGSPSSFAPYATWASSRTTWLEHLQK